MFGVVLVYAIVVDAMLDYCIILLALTLTLILKIGK